MASWWPLVFVRVHVYVYVVLTFREAAQYNVLGSLPTTGLSTPDLTSEVWTLPAQVEIKGDALRYKRGNEPAGTDTGMLRDFLALADAEAPAFADFASRWGVLGLCAEHGRPTGGVPGQVVVDPRHVEPQDWGAEPTLHDRLFCPLQVWRGWTGESLDVWRYYTRAFRTVITVAGVLQQKRRKMPGDEEWRELWADVIPAGESPISRYHENTLLALVNGFLDLAGVAPRMVWNKSGPDVRYVTGGLFGALSLQLALEVAHAPYGLRLCENPKCPNGGWFTPADPRQRRCAHHECRNKYRQRRAQQKRRQKVAQAKPRAATSTKDGGGR